MIKLDRISNEYMRRSFEGTNIGWMMKENRLRWFGRFEESMI